MKYQTLGKSGLSVSKIAFGCMSLEKGNYAENEKLLLEAFEKGIILFDTADLYDNGENEITLGKALKPIREKVIISTKVGNQMRPDGKTWDWNPTKNYILAAVENSLKRLQTDYIDLYQLHGGTIDDPIDETIEAFEILKQQGKIRFYGISSIRPNVIREYVKRSDIVSIMMQYSVLDRRPEQSCFPLLQENNIGVLARGSLAKGILPGKSADAYLDRNQSEISKAVECIKAFSADGRSPAETAIQFALHHPAVSSAVVGIRTERQLNDAISAVEKPMLSELDYLQIAGSIPVNYYKEHL
ncbi:aldo/keto reductase [Pinibacter soli]|uniref:Aldo/keto reductase n=1 Tax=Pinibacter soli TaxID=3044211 RepID=A0ABT6RAX4_9BACT|nr:aldo/keto reductase [Pinibacter soli]MDI3319699.1 aldo/keto reductase [Pinibacter soli]